MCVCGGGGGGTDTPTLSEKSLGQPMLTSTPATSFSLQQWRYKDQL